MQCIQYIQGKRTDAYWWWRLGHCKSLYVTADQSQDLGMDSFSDINFDLGKDFKAINVAENVRNEEIWVEMKTFFKNQHPNSACHAFINAIRKMIKSLSPLIEQSAVVLTSMTGVGHPQQQGQDGTHQDRMQGSHIVVLKVKSSALNLKKPHSEGTEWVSSFGTCYRILLYVKGQGWGGTVRGTPSPTSTPSSILIKKKKKGRKNVFSAL